MLPAVMIIKSSKEGVEDQKIIVYPERRADRALKGIRRVYSKVPDVSRRTIVRLYARFGLHRFNFLMGQEVQPCNIMEYTQSTFSVTCSYKITFKAKDPASAKTKPTLATFQAQVNEIAFNRFALVSANSGPYPVETKIYNVDKSNVLCGHFLHHFMPKLLTGENPFQDDTGRFRLLKKTEVLKNEWIHLYLELAVATTNRRRIEHGVGGLKIRKVAMEIPRDLEPFHKGLGAYDAIFYIRYTDPCKDRAGDDDGDRVALVRRIVDVHSGIFRIVGLTQSFQSITPPAASNGTAAMEMEASPQD
ncbi:hypothetical protein CARUB_v10014257mg [Capsella rubella]|uniref:Uncharacterized protein n=1 Tax=Capsella rubella TaxID=81985 RepID=R0HN15_9BRAS|nr:UPF0725 protein At3g25080 [Capsella rubella]EOA31104.1 hypothetical protein CARUB_v10014257mg [Capsella rubella]